MAKKIDAKLLKSYMMGAADPAGSDKYSSSMFGAEIDLHMDSSTFRSGKYDQKYAREYQLEALEKAIDQAIAANKPELRVIHGIGTGRLKTDVQRILAAHPGVSYFECKSHPRYGLGSTIAYFK